MASATVWINIESTLIRLLDDFALPGSRLEPTDVEFKCDFDGLKPTWFDVLKHVVAMANGGGGVIVFGVDKNGNRSGIRDSLLQTFDPANVSNKLRSYTSARVASSYREIIRDGKLFGFLQVSASDRLVVFESDGNYQGSDGKPARAFVKGVVYTRVPGSTREAEQVDLDTLVDRIVQDRITSILARIDRVAHAPLESDLVISRPEDTSRGMIIGKSLPVRIVPDVETGSKVSAPLRVRLVPDDPEALPVSEIADASIPFTSLDAELQTQVRLWRQSDTSHRISRLTLSRLYVHRRDLTISPEAAEMCFVSAVYSRGYPMFWASAMDRTRLKEVVDYELNHGKSPMTEALPFVVCAFMWNDRQILLRPSSKTRQKLKARNMVSTLLGFGSQSEFVRGARRGGTSFEVSGKTYSVNSLMNDHARATAVFEELIQLDYEKRIDDKQRALAHRLDLILHADVMASNAPVA